ncbi:MAG: phytanoyl-CoA dioxygenase family protein [Candidatus Latescibacteria bacterium]|nr:phytanoyl-CoA dioxygenase family protein [Candidatus Latescibacterota bacterium]
MAATASTTDRITLTPEQVDSFREHGYLRIGKLLDDDLVELLRREYDREFELAHQHGGFRNLAIDNTDDLDAKNNAEVQMLQIMQMCERNVHFRRLLYNDQILDLVEPLLGPNIQLFHDQALYKPARHGGPVFWHQDNAYWRCVPANLVSCWMTLDDADVRNGAMQLLPGSHLRPLMHPRSASTNALLDLGDTVDASKAVVIDLPAGGAMLHHCQTLHYTAPNTTDRQRRAFIIHFMTPGTKSLHSGEYIRVSFTNPMLRMRV